MSSAAGDNTPQSIDEQGQSVMPSAVAYHPVTGEIKKITGVSMEEEELAQLLVDLEQLMAELGLDFIVTQERVLGA